MGNLRPFQIILIGVFIALALGGLVFFATFQGFGVEKNQYGDSVEIWGTLSERVFARMLQEQRGLDPNLEVVSYVQKDPRTFENELVNAIAENRGPDIVVLPNDILLKQRAKLYAIPYDLLPARNFRDTYVDGAEVFQLSNGTYGIPFAVDPLVMYWNRSMFSSSGLAAPPTTWEEIVARTTPALTRRTAEREILQSAVAFGEGGNVTNAKEILLMQMLQLGSPLVIERNNRFEVLLDTSIDSTSTRSPGEAALDFYGQFSNPLESVYSWNGAMPFDREEFLAGDLGLYFGFGSELQSLVNGNPNLNFDAAPVPQDGAATINRGFGRFYALTLLRSSDNFNGSYLALLALSGQDASGSLAEGLGLAPVHRNIIAGGNSNPFLQTMYNGALIARGWLDPDSAASDNVFVTMIDDFTSGRSRLEAAVNDAEARLTQLLR